MANAVAQPDSSDSVGFTFVELMFAVAVGDAAIQIGKVMQAVRLTGDYFLKDIRQVSPSIAHLLLAVLVIACSWVGWRRSNTTRYYMERLEGVFTWSFLILLVDIFLVICYFILAEGAEIPVKPKFPTDPLRVTASAQPETVWVAVIMVTYVVWNVLTIRMSVPHVRRGLRAIHVLFVATLAVAIWYLEGSVVRRRDVVCVDCQLMALVLLFRVPLATQPKWALVFLVLLLAAVAPIWWLV